MGDEGAGSDVPGRIHEGLAGDFNVLERLPDFYSGGEEEASYVHNRLAAGALAASSFGNRWQLAAKLHRAWQRFACLLSAAALRFGSCATGGSAGAAPHHWPERPRHGTVSPNGLWLFGSSSRLLELATFFACFWRISGRCVVTMSGAVWTDF